MQIPVGRKEKMGPLGDQRRENGECHGILKEREDISEKWSCKPGNGQKGTEREEHATARPRK